MKALSGYAEWFWLMAKGCKDVENRNWSLASKGIHRSQLPLRIYLHASKTRASREERLFILRTLTFDQADEFLAVYWPRYRGHIIGEITITDEITADEVIAILPGTPWFFGPYGFVVKYPELYDKPIPYRGQLGFFEVKL